MVNIDTVYQKVLTFANKEQRGYITPQEFNLFANQAQEEVFEQYFYDTKYFRKVPGNDTVYADVSDMLEEKMQIFEKVDEASAISAYSYNINGYGQESQLPSNMYRVSKVQYSANLQPRFLDCELLNSKDFEALKNATGTLATSAVLPVANIKGNFLRVWNGSIVINSLYIRASRISYFRKPEKVSWGYFVVGGKALYDSSNLKTKHFELHAAEETELVYKILKFAGVSIKRTELTQIAQGAETMQNQQEKQ